MNIYTTDKYNQTMLNFVKIKSFDKIFNNISLEISTDIDAFIFPGASIEKNIILLNPSLFHALIFNYEFTVEHITAILGHEFGHFKFNHDNIIVNNSIKEEFYADQYSIKVLHKMNINPFYMKNSLELLLSIKNEINKVDEDNLIERINRLNK